jgi:mRNA interferase MazF
VTGGEISTASGAGGYAGKPRPVVIPQDDRFDVTVPITVCAFITDSTKTLLTIPVTFGQLSTILVAEFFLSS